LFLSISLSLAVSFLATSTATFSSSGVNSVTPVASLVSAATLAAFCATLRAAPNLLLSFFVGAAPEERADTDLRVQGE
jgi:hypothetical protein